MTLVLTRMTLKIRDVVQLKIQIIPIDSLILWASLSRPIKSKGSCPACVGNGETVEILYRKFHELTLSPVLTLRTIRWFPQLNQAWFEPSKKPPNGLVDSKASFGPLPGDCSSSDAALSRSQIEGWSSTILRI